MTSTHVHIDHVSDTALWVAYYRAKESLRADALFQDPLAQRLIGDRGKKIAENMKQMGRYTEWAVISRTVIIDQFIMASLTEGVDTVINLGAGLDTRPYRMNLPADLNWIEVDHPQIIELKNSTLKSEVPKCRLTRCEIDLSDLAKRRAFLDEVSAQSKNILILTEGVIPYLSQDQVALLADDLYAQPKISSWITEYFNAEVYRYLKASVRTQKMRNAPFLFYPPDWMAFFAQHSWVPKTTVYSNDIAKKYHRKVPMPWWANLLMPFVPSAVRERSKKMTGYTLFQKRI